MTKAKRMALIGALAHRLRARGSWCGETHIQKSVYFLQGLLRVRTDFDFILYKHGPYSFDLRDTLSEMRGEGLLELRQQTYPYGPSLMVPAERYADLERRFPNTLARHRDRLDFVANHLGNKRVSELEQIATALYVILEGVGTVDQKAREIVAFKPHVSMEDAKWAIRSVEDMRTEATGLIATRLD